MNKVRILGIDPGSSRCGWGLIEKRGSRLKLIRAGMIEIKTKDPAQKLFYLGRNLERLLTKLKPDLVTIEKLYFSKNIKTGIEVAQARGVIVYLVANHRLPITEFTPQQIKRAVTNYGGADKKAVAKMIKLILSANLQTADDTTDALAIAITAAALASSRSAVF